LIEVARVNELTELLRRSAAVLAGGGLPEADADVSRLIAALGYASGDMAKARERAALLAAAAKLRHLFQLRAPDAPGLVFFGGEADPSLIGWKGTGHDPISLAGAGLSIAQAFESCVGEGVEYLSQFDTDADQLERATLGQLAPSLGKDLACFVPTLLRTVGIASTQPIDWIPATRLHDRARVWLPADMCLRRSADGRDFTAPFKLSTGCGAGASFDDAALHGLCELIERDAVALWWRGGRRARAVDAEGKAGRAASALLSSLRGDEKRRVSWLLDITTDDIGVPCVAAVSTAPDGFGMACGFAARPTLQAAVRAAIFEMCQIELGRTVVEAKRREGGEAALNDADRAFLRRTSEIDASRCPLLHPDGPSGDDAATCVVTLQALTGRLLDLGIEAFVLDLTRPVFAIPVARIIAPQLQLEPSAIVTRRLAEVTTRTGGGDAYTGGVPLL
jgi:ribosomal protein S12 methylthiotransferase accessory factor